jgi:hypothetical protein
MDKRYAEMAHNAPTGTSQLLARVQMAMKVPPDYPHFGLSWAMTRCFPLLTFYTIFTGCFRSSFPPNLRPIYIDC